MQIACDVIHQTIRSKDLKGRAYTMNLTHYVECGTGRIVRTRSHQITPERVAEQRAKREPVQHVEIGATQPVRPSARSIARMTLERFLGVVGY